MFNVRDRGVGKLHVVKTGRDQYQRERKHRDDGSNVVALFSLRVPPGTDVGSMRRTRASIRPRSSTWL